MRALAAALLLLPAPGLAQDDQTREALIAALAMHQCAVTEEETPEVFGAQGFDGEFVRRELGQMVLDGTAFLEGGYILRVKADYCPPADPVPTPAQTLRRKITERGCSIHQRDIESLGMDADRMRPIVAGWLRQGVATVKGRTLMLEGCG